jgi:transposase
MLGRWVSEHRVNGGQSFRGNGNLTPDQEEIRKVRSQVKNLRMEKEILKKATVFFAKEMK